MVQHPLIESSLTLTIATAAQKVANKENGVSKADSGIAVSNLKT